MIAGGVGNIASTHVAKSRFAEGSLIVQLGGPAMLIGLGGGAASSMGTGTNEEGLDFDSVQRGNAEIERRAQEVIDRCCALGEANPILSIHDVGAGGLSNAVPELVHSAGRGGSLDLREVPNEEPGMSPMQIWCNEAQERYVLAIAPEAHPVFEAICERERCPFAVLGAATDDGRLTVEDPLYQNKPVDMDLAVLLGKPPKMRRDVQRVKRALPAFDATGIDLHEAALRVLRLPAVADKTFLISIGDRSVGGLTARDQMVGPWQVPVADVAVTAMGYQTYRGEAFAMGERTPLAVIDPEAAGRMAVGEALTNIAAAPIAAIEDVKLSANWMAAAGHPGEDAALYDTVRAVALDLCPALGVSIPVGKDSLSMKTVWQDATGAREVASPLSLIVSAFAPVTDVRRTLTPQLADGLRRERPRADRSRRGQGTHGRFGARAGLRTDGKRSAGCRRCAAGESVLRRDSGAQCGRKAPRVSRSLRWRRIRHRLRDDVRRARRRRARARARSLFARRGGESRVAVQRRARRSGSGARPAMCESVLAACVSAGLGDCVQVDRSRDERCPADDRCE